MRKELLDLLHLEETFFQGDFALIDEVSFKDIDEAITKYECTFKPEECNLKTIDVLMKFPNMLCWGNIHKDGTMSFGGVYGFPFDDGAVEYITPLAKDCFKSNITERFVSVEW